MVGDCRSRSARQQAESAGKFRRRGLQPLAGPSIAGRFRNAHACQTPSVESRGLLILHGLAAAPGLRSTVLTFALPLPMRTEGTATALFTLCLDPPVRADATASALFARALDPQVRADGAATTLFTL